jgi:hypothetical protein
MELLPASALKESEKDEVAPRHQRRPVRLAPVVTEHGPQRTPTAHKEARGSRADFMHAVEVLSVIGPSCDCRAELPWDGRPTLVVCRYETWERIFGEPEQVQIAAVGPMHRPFHVWRHVCSDGPVQCVGHLLERPQGACVVLTRICLF